MDCMTLSMYNIEVEKQKEKSGQVLISWKIAQSAKVYFEKQTSVQIWIKSRFLPITYLSSFSNA